MLHSRQIKAIINDFIGNRPHVVHVLIELINTYPALQPTVPDIFKTYLKLVQCFDNGNMLFLCGNGGSFADCLHISGELMKSFIKKRPLSDHDKAPFTELPHGREIADALEYGFPVLVLGLNHSLFSALENDNPTRYIGFAQELFNLGKKGDLLLGISTSGNAQNVIYAATTARARGLVTIGLTGQNGGQLAKITDVAIRVPQSATNKAQELHLPVYHSICAMIEAHYF